MKTYPSAAAAAAALAAVLAPAAAALADEKADALLRQVAATTRATKTLRADLEITFGEKQSLMKSTGTVSLMKPNYARIVLKNGPYAQTVASTGTTTFVLQQNQYRKSPAKADAPI